MDKFDIMKLNELSIEQVAQALGLSVNRHKALCPFHNDSNPSLTFSVRKNRYRCFVCGASGGPIDLVMNYLHKDFLSACKWLSEEHSVVITVPQPSSLNPKPSRSFDPTRFLPFFERPFLSQEAQKFLFEERRLDPRVVRYCRLTSWRDKKGTPWLQIPHYDREGHLIGIQNRNLIKGATPRFRFPSGAKCTIYNLPVLNLLRPGETLFITEGCSDCWAMLSSGHKAIAIPSATLLSRKDAKLLETLNLELGTKFAMYPDADIPGERLCLQLQQVLPSLVRLSLPAGCKDFSELYLQRLNPSTLISQPSTGFSEPVTC
jgi:DNA primase